MKRLLISLFGAMIVLVGYRPISAGEVSDAISSAGPVLTTFNHTTIMAWAGASSAAAEPVRYASFDGDRWSPTAEVRDALTLSAPALTAAGTHVYLATTPPNAKDEIHLFVSSGDVFVPAPTPICDGDICAQTTAAPALAGDSTALYAAWTTLQGTIMVGSYLNGAWKIQPAAIPDAVTTPAAGPALAVFDNALYVAWVTPSGRSIAVESTPLPLTGSSWSAPSSAVRTPITVQARTNVAPVLGVLTDTLPAVQRSLYLAWAAPLGIDFAYWDGADSQWVPAASPFPLPEGPRTGYTPALNSFTFLNGEQECRLSNNLAYTEGGEGTGHRHGGIHFKQVKQICP
jgi:hypothetical protein